MGLIKKPSELTIPQTIKMMIYGQAGMGKTTLALSAPRPLMLDFDGGIHRANFGHQCDAVQVRNWKEVLDVLKENLSEYDTIIVDTVGKMLDFIITHICPVGNPRIQDWGKINQEFASFNRSVSALNKNVIYVAHRDLRKEGDDNVFVPALREKSYTSIVTELDLLGYVEAKGTARTITFNPTSRNDGKNTCNLPGLMNIPTVVDAEGNPLKNDFIQTGIISVYQKGFETRRESLKAFESVINDVKDQIELCTDAESINDLISRLDKFSHVGSSLIVSKQLIVAKASILGLKYNPDAKAYEAV